MIVAIIGLGLIGGSFAISIRKRGLAGRIIGVDRDEKNAETALNIGLVDDIFDLYDAVTAADLVIVAVPVDQTKVILTGVLDRISNMATVMDTGSTKQGICASVSDHNKRKRFVATHPIAGTENFGPLAAISNLYNGKLSIICDREKSADDALEIVQQLYKSIGMNIVYMNPEEHDLHSAYVSHLSHISSFMLGLTVLEIEKNEKTIFELAGSGFASTVRLAKSSPEMWTPIFEQNSHYLLNALDTYIDKLKIFREAIEKKDTVKLTSLMRQANDIRRILDGKKLSEEKLITNRD
ncbi:prephenate dehydrogenase [bacterium BMS3Abin03]|nr:prephenate dehydrogenase [bacterium BMS3Abin03]HDZ58795.1 prephenate dehydrogenase [Ignavibacteriales bacterium]